MNPQLSAYIDAARKKKQSDDKIRAGLVGAGWNEADVDAALGGDSDLPVPPPPPSTGNQRPIAVAHTATTRGFEYVIMVIALWVYAFCFGGILHSLVGSLFGSESSGAYTAYTAALFVSFPVFAFLFLRTKKHELADDNVRSDPSRRRAIQLTMLISFVVGLGHIVYYVYSLIGGNGADGVSVWENTLQLCVTLLVAGSIFSYYWIDEHRQR